MGTLQPLTIDDAFWRCLTLAACYQLAQFVLKIGFALSKGWIGGGGHIQDMPCSRLVALR